LFAPEVPAGFANITAHGSGSLVRWEFALGRPLSELAILTVAREFDQPYEWSLHEIEALAVGLEQQVIDVVREREGVTDLSDEQAIIIQMGREVYGEHSLAAETYARAEALLGRANLVDIVLLMGEYAEDAVRLTAINQHMPPGWPQFLPLPFTQPDDIYADSQSRLPYLRDEMRGPSATPSLYGRGIAPEGTGPGQFMRRNPAREILVESVGQRLVRLAVLVTARELDDVYQWTTNEIEAGDDGLESSVIDIVRRRASVESLADEDAALIELGREVLGDHTVSPPTYARALEIFGETNLVGLVNVMAKTAFDAAVYIAFHQHLPAGQEPTLIIP
ncbi:MAG: hypothetical protein ACR2QQ_04205, partial [Gammaproteobacteria bacterium]